MIYRIVHTGQLAKPSERRRLWLEPGMPVIIGPGQLLTFVINQQDEEAEPAVRIQVPGQVFESAVPAGYELDVSAWSALWVIPRAIELTDRGEPRRLLVEFVRTHQDIVWAV